MSAIVEGDDLCARMQRIRNRMDAKADVVRVDAQNLLDWRCYVAQYPWGSLALAAAIGFWLTPGPRVMPTVKLAEASMDELTKRGAAAAEPPRQTEGWLRPLAGFAMSLAAKSLMGYVSSRIAASMSQPEADRSEAVA